MPRPLIAAVLTAATLAAPAQALDLEAMTDAEREAFRAEVRAYLMDNPEIIMEAVQVLEERQAQAQVQQDLDLVQVNAEEIFNDGFSWVGGNPDGDITLVEFLDYRCSFCKRAHEDVTRLIEEDGNIRYIVKEFPILGPESVLASRFALSVKDVAGDDAYHQVLDALMTFQGNIGQTSLRRLAEGLGLDADAVMAGMDADDISRRISETRALAQRLQITGTPTFVLEDQMLRGYVPLEQMEIMVADARDD